MNSIAQNIRNRLSLRKPQEESLAILADIVDKLTLKKNADLPTELEKIKSSYPILKSFERNFPSVCFALATGVGKTRLMGAFISYLYLEKGIKNYFVLAPNLTVYNKLIEDLSNPSNPKYVFKGIGDFAVRPPKIITGDNYEFALQGDIYESKININIFNISKINSETRKGGQPRIKRLKEYIGDSYFNHLSSLDDLVLLMDESHHYRADRGMEVINELNPILGLELTATPQVERSGGAINFNNVVYEYSLGHAIRDGFVKEPAVATRKDFDPSKYSLTDIDRIKLIDGIRIHEDTKVALEIYARDNKTRIVKPFVLVVAKDTDHSRLLKELICSSGFFEGYYADKVMEIHSAQSGSEKDENIAQLLSLEDGNNKIEIVIHVNMLKEGWDVTNLYTIIPLRTAASTTLREQTIGRGLRLPYGKKTGNDKVDKLTIVAHDKFQAIIEEANKPDSIIRRENIIEIDSSQIDEKKEVVTSTAKINDEINEEQRKIDNITEPKKKEKAQISLEVKKTILSTISELNSSVNSVNDLTRKEIKDIALEKIKQKIYGDPQQNLFAADMLAEATRKYEGLVKEFILNIIEIPRIILQQSNEVKSGFNDFDLNTDTLNFKPVSEEILIQKLREQKNKQSVIKGGGGIITDGPDKLIVTELINYPEINYDDQSDLLFKLARQAIDKFKIYLDDENKINNVVQYHIKEIGKYIHLQLMNNFYCETPKYEKPVVRPFTVIEEHNFSKLSKDKIHVFNDTIKPISDIPNKIFSGFSKSCHNLYKFDSKTEKDFVILIENDKSVIKWLRPAYNQFYIYWDHNSKRYHPDFVVESKDSIYMVETKKESDIKSQEVQDKKIAALQYCTHASAFTSKNGGKPWKYLLIPHNAVLLNMSFDTLVNSYIQE